MDFHGFSRYIVSIGHQLSLSKLGGKKNEISPHEIWQSGSSLRIALQSERPRDGNGSRKDAALVHSAEQPPQRGRSRSAWTAGAQADCSERPYSTEVSHAAHAFYKL